MSIRKKAAVVGMAVMLSAAVVAEQHQWGVDVTADFFGKYIWRGQNLTDSTVFQPGVDLSYAGLTGSVWGNLDMTDVNDDRGKFNEWNFGIDYSDAVPGVEGVDFSIGAIYYRFPSASPSSTTELYWGFAFDVWLEPSVTVYHDVDEAKGTYVELGAGHSFEDVFHISPDVPVSVEIAASLGWADSDFNDYYWGVDSSRFTDLALSLALPMEIGGWTVAPSLNYVTLLSDRLRATNEYASKSDYVFAGLSLSTGF